jgi:hypothetical protein
MLLFESGGTGTGTGAGFGGGINVGAGVGVFGVFEELDLPSKQSFTWTETSYFSLAPGHAWCHQWDSLPR